MGVGPSHPTPSTPTGFKARINHELERIREEGVREGQIMALGKVLDMLRAELMKCPSTDESPEYQTILDMTGKVSALRTSLH